MILVNRIELTNLTIV